MYQQKLLQDTTWSLCPTLVWSQLIVLLLLMAAIPDIAVDWCSLDTGYATIPDGRGYPHSVFISATRDGSIWIRVGQDHKSLDWIYHNEYNKKEQVTFLEEEAVSMLETLHYTDLCVLTDLELNIHTEGGWHLSYLNVYDPSDRQRKVVVIRRIPDVKRRCAANTTLSLHPNGQSLTCSGGPIHTCGYRTVPDKGQLTPPVFMIDGHFDPNGTDHLVCATRKTNNSFSLSGSYYHAFVKMESCDKPEDSRLFGHESKLRAFRDTGSDAILIPDPQQTALADGVVVGWQAYAKMISINHQVYLQVWRPSKDSHFSYTLVGQTFFQPSELRVQKLTLEPRDYIHLKQGDVLGLYYPQFNPLTWSAVPCAYPQQRHLYVNHPQRVGIGVTSSFYRDGPGPHACRHYSFNAILANKTNFKIVEDWICPTAQAPPGSYRREGAELKNGAIADQNDVTNSNRGNKPEQNNNLFHYDNGIVPIHLVLIIIGSLILLFSIIGFISYYRALKS